MFKRHSVAVRSNTSCKKSVDGLTHDDFKWYDKDGFELNSAERKFYTAMGHPIHHLILNHTAWQEPWFELENKDSNLSLDHSMILCRCNYEDAALEQLTKLQTTIPMANFLIQTKNKWGYDFALDATIDNQAFEVLHVEYDNYNYDKYESSMIWFDQYVRHADWTSVASSVWSHRDEWTHLHGFEQNHWKAKFLLGWNKAEHLEKTI